jgi:phosphatidylserine/phosphatidylglycerophosphate/cardiolipin synthase-like enzyme
MRSHNASGPLSVRAISGTYVVLMAWDVAKEARAGLRGFAIKHQVEGSNKPPRYLEGTKFFKSLIPAPVKGDTYPSDKHPFQTFLWSDYSCDPGVAHKFTIEALYGDVGALDARYSVDIEIDTEPTDDGRHGIWFNRGAIASHALSKQFQNKPVTEEMFNAVDAKGHPIDKEVKWLSRGLEEACLDYINGTQPGEGLRVCAYEFTYAPILDALKAAHDRGVDVKIVYHYTKKTSDANLKAINKAGLKGKTILFQRTRTPIPHNKFIVKIVGHNPVQVWTGSTNFTNTGIYGQSNVGHLVTNSAVAQTYLDYWKVVAKDLTHANQLKETVALTPNPGNVPASGSVIPFFSPRIADNMLDWYSSRIDDAAALVMMTIPFTVSPTILKGFDQDLPSLRLVILEDQPTKEVKDAEKRRHGKLAFSNGAILGKTFIKYKAGAGGAKVGPIPNSPLDEWFIDEELARPTNAGHVFFVHTKFLLVDPLSDDPLVCSGSANFSKNSLTSNDENMLLIRGDTRVADIYLTEFDRIFRHFYARDAINAMATKPGQKNPLELDEGFAWIDPNFKEGSYKNNRRLLFFPDANGPATAKWADKAKNEPDLFADEAARAKAAKKKKVKTPA